MNSVNVEVDELSGDEDLDYAADSDEDDVDDVDDDDDSASDDDAKGTHSTMTAATLLIGACSTA